jgi:hypothetical protein
VRAVMPMRHVSLAYTTPTAAGAKLTMYVSRAMTKGPRIKIRPAVPGFSVSAQRKLAMPMQIARSASQTNVVPGAPKTKGTALISLTPSARQRT